MGLLSFIKAKLGKPSLKKQAEQKAYRLASLADAVRSVDLKRDTLSGYNASNGLQIRTGESNFQDKTAQFEGFATDLFAEIFVGKTFDDVIAFVKDLKNFAPESEYMKKIETINKRRSQSISDKGARISAEGLFQYFAGAAQGLTVEDASAYQAIARNTQARARALAFIKANFFSICNMRSLVQEDEKTSITKFKELFAIIKEYCDQDINGYVISEFSSENVDSKIIRSSDKLLKGAYYAQRRSDELALSRINSELARAGVIGNIAQNLGTTIQDYDRAVNDVDYYNHIKLAREYALRDSLTSSEGKLIEALEFYRSSPNCQDNELGKPWVTGKKDVASLSVTRQKALIASLKKIAQSIDLFSTMTPEEIAQSTSYYDKDKDSMFAFYDAEGNENTDIASQTPEMFNIFSGFEDGNYNAFLATIYEYNQSQGDGSQVLLKVKIDEDGRSILYTTAQEKVLKGVYSKLTEYAKEQMDKDDFDGNALKNLAYSTFKQSIDDVRLGKLSELLFGTSLKKGSKFTSFAHLTAKQLNALNEFVCTYKPVKTFFYETGLSDSDVANYEVDRQLVDSLTPARSGNSCKLKYVMNAMQRASVEQGRKNLLARAAQNDYNIQTDEATRATRFSDAQIANDRFDSLREEIGAVEEKETLKISGKNVSTERNNDAKTRISKMIELIKKNRNLPQTAEEVSSDTRRVGSINVATKASKKTITATEATSRFVRHAEETTAEYTRDKNSLASLSKQEKADIYKKYMTPSDYEKVSEYVDKIDDTIYALVTTEKYPTKRTAGKKKPQVQPAEVTTDNAQNAQPASEEVSVDAQQPSNAQDAQADAPTDDAEIGQIQ